MRGDQYARALVGMTVNRENVDEVIRFNAEAADSDPRVVVHEAAVIAAIAWRRVARSKAETSGTSLANGH